MTVARLPEWLRKKRGPIADIHRVKSILRRRGLNTVCESARCPNMGECFSKPTATFLILGTLCTRGCGFCDIEGGSAPSPPDVNEPENIARAAKELGLSHVVITSVTRDDLDDGGASHFSLTIQAIRGSMAPIFIEVLTPDFGGERGSLATVLDAGPDIFNHNIETVPSLYPVVRPRADYATSLALLKEAGEWKVMRKSGIMVGLGEKRGEVAAVMEDLREAGCEALTIGQYLQPGKGALPVREYVRPEVFSHYEEVGRAMGFTQIHSAPFVRSSYNAEESFSAAGRRRGGGR